MKRPRHGIHSTRTRTPVETMDEPIQVDPVPVILSVDNTHPEYHPLPSGLNLIADNED
jgi:hypothetical protein